MSFSSVESLIVTVKRANLKSQTIYFSPSLKTIPPCMNLHGPTRKVLDAKTPSDNALLIKLGPPSESRVRACPGLCVSPSAKACQSRCLLTSPDEATISRNDGRERGFEFKSKVQQAAAVLGRTRIRRACKVAHYLRLG